MAGWRSGGRSKRGLMEDMKSAGVREGGRTGGDERVAGDWLL